MMLANAARMTEQLATSGMDGVIAATYENLLYTTGISSVALEMFPHTGQVFAVLTADEPGRPAFVSSRCEVDQFLDAGMDLADTIGYGTFFREEPKHRIALNTDDRALAAVNGDGVTPADAASALAIALRSRSLATSVVGYDEYGMSARVLAKVRGLLPAAEFVPAADVLRQVRKVKTPAEIQRLRAAVAAAEAGIEAAVAQVEVGATERGMVTALETELARWGARARFSLIKFGPRAVAGQTRPTGDPLQAGESIWFDVGCVLDGYWADIARTFRFGAADDRQRTLYDAMRAGADAAYAAAKPGMSGGELYDLTIAAVRDSGAPHYRRGHVGHGVGVEVYDPVLIRPGETDELEEGTVVNIETPYYEFGFGAVHIEDPFVVSLHGNEWLTTLSRDLGELDMAAR